jgi:hypothetical protein
MVPRLRLLAVSLIRCAAARGPIRRSWSPFSGEHAMDTETTADREALDYWGAADIDSPIGIVPFPWGRYVCPNHAVDETDPATTCEPLLVLTAKTGEARIGA